MSQFITIISILLPLFIGFAIRVPKKFSPIIDRFLSVLVYLILLFIGTDLAQTDNLTGEIGKIFTYTAVLFALLAVCNLAIMMWFDRQFFAQHPFQQHASERNKISLADSGKQLAVLVFGLIMGRILPDAYLPPAQTGHYALMMLIFAVGIQLRSNGVPLRQILLNKHGFWLSVWFMGSCLLAGLLFALVMPDVSWGKGLALSSGYGWYSLSGIVMTQAYGATWGSIALLNDLIREFCALAFIPLLMRRYPSTAIGIGGATSLDFTLPVIQKSGGMLAVPVAISFGFIVNLVAPFLMVLFSAF